jgi:N-acetylglucosamine kinase-like BadF-type ATPase
MGVDGGGSKTHCIVADSSGHLLGFGSSGASNWESVGLEGARQALAAAMAAAVDRAGISPTELSAAVFGLGGVDWPSDVERLEPVLKCLHVASHALVLNDAFIALRAGTDNRAMGVVIVAGSGTTVAGRNGTETYRTLGQGGPLFDDFGSASDVADRAVQAVARAFTGRGPETVLSRRLCEMTGAHDVAGLLEGLSRGSILIPDAAPAVLAEAEEGDVAAIEIVVDVGRALGGSAAVAIRRLKIETESFDVVLAGGLFRGLNDLLWNAIRQPVLDAAPRATLVRLGTPPVAGAGLLALESIDAPAGPEIRRYLSEACSIEAGKGWTNTA